MANKRFYKDLRTLAKRANQRMVELEKINFRSPAYQSVQAKLEILGRSSATAKGRRFSETGKATYNEYMKQKKILEEFLSQKTSTLTGAHKYEREIFETSEEKYNLDEAGITREQWAEFWQNMPGKHRDRMFSSDRIIAMVKAYNKKSGGLEPEGALTMAEIAEEIQAQSTLKGAYKAIGITYKEVNAMMIKK